jgi:hypothetical protein
VRLPHKNRLISPRKGSTAAARIGSRATSNILKRTALVATTLHTDRFTISTSVGVTSLFSARCAKSTRAPRLSFWTLTARQNLNLTLVQLRYTSASICRHFASPTPSSLSFLLMRVTRSSVRNSRAQSEGLDGLGQHSIATSNLLPLDSLHAHQVCSLRLLSL